jgi:hypothetical protein
MFTDVSEERTTSILEVDNEGIVTWTPKAFLGNGWINTFPWIRNMETGSLWAMLQLVTTWCNNADNGGECFLCGQFVAYIMSICYSLDETDICVEAGSNNSIVTLRVVGGDEKGSLKSEAVKYGCESQGTRTLERLRWQEPAAYTKDRPVLSS